MTTNTASHQKQSAYARHSAHSRTRQTIAAPESANPANQQSKTRDSRAEMPNREHRLGIGRKKALGGGLFIKSPTTIKIDIALQPNRRAPLLDDFIRVRSKDSRSERQSRTNQQPNRWQRIKQLATKDRGYQEYQPEQA